MRRNAQQQMHMVGSNVAAEHGDVVRAADLTNQITHMPTYVPRSTGLRYFVLNTKW